MAIKDVVKVSRKTFFAPKSWFGYNTVRSQTFFLWNIIRNVFSGLFIPRRPTQSETFLEARERLNLTNQDIENTKKLYLQFCLFFSSISFIFIALFVYYLIGWHISASLISLSLALLLLALAFRYHFWYFQIKHQKLGCTFEEWRRGQVLEQGDH